jgi:hypothetical protein
MPVRTVYDLSESGRAFFDDPRRGMKPSCAPLTPYRIQPRYRIVPHEIQAEQLAAELRRTTR